MNIEVFERNLALDREQQRAVKGRWRFLCLMLPHRWNFTHLFDDEPDFSGPFRDYGASNYAGICRRCGKRDLFRGRLRAALDSSKLGGGE